MVIIIIIKFTGLLASTIELFNDVKLIGLKCVCSGIN